MKKMPITQNTANLNLSDIDAENIFFFNVDLKLS